MKGWQAWSLLESRKATALSSLPTTVGWAHMRCTWVTVPQATLLLELPLFKLHWPQSSKILELMFNFRHEAWDFSVTARKLKDKHMLKFLAGKWPARFLSCSTACKVLIAICCDLLAWLLVEKSIQMLGSFGHSPVNGWSGSCPMQVPSCYFSAS